MNLPGERGARIWAGAMALGSFIGFVPPLQWSMTHGATLLQAIWLLLGAFTIIANSLIVIVFGTIAVRGRPSVSPNWIGCATLSILLVGIVFNLVLGQIPQQSWFGRLGDSLHHHVMPVLVPLWWLVHAPKGRLTRDAPLRWAAFPLVYAAYSLLRAQLTPPDVPGRYPYFFMNVEMLSWGPVLINIAVIAAGFLLVGCALVALDRRLVRPAAESA